MAIPADINIGKKKTISTQKHVVNASNPYTLGKSNKTKPSLIDIIEYMKLHINGNIPTNNKTL
jgi:hypothetical protein